LSPGFYIFFHRQMQRQSERPKGVHRAQVRSAARAREFQNVRFAIRDRSRSPACFEACVLQGAERPAAAYLFYAIRAVKSDCESFVRSRPTANKFALPCSVD